MEKFKLNCCPKQLIAFCSLRSLSFCVLNLPIGAAPLHPPRHEQLLQSQASSSAQPGQSQKLSFKALEAIKQLGGSPGGAKGGGGHAMIRYSHG